ncbi:hypothetical protein BKA70DRAFT_1300434 [Coprinopsis sp. MPI-PUGE-AT-0042]|nr:hypothetical protein BKA70DRAFT_1300434 [Coprinopsis sp. MPI-PUGE-AT-0042]
MTVRMPIQHTTLLLSIPTQTAGFLSRYFRLIPYPLAPPANTRTATLKWHGRSHPYVADILDEVFDSNLLVCIQRLNEWAAAEVDNEPGSFFSGFNRRMEDISHDDLPPLTRAQRTSECLSDLQRSINDLTRLRLGKRVCPGIESLISCSEQELDNYVGTMKRIFEHEGISSTERVRNAQGIVSEMQSSIRDHSKYLDIG